MLAGSSSGYFRVRNWRTKNEKPAASGWRGTTRTKRSSRLLGSGSVLIRVFAAKETPVTAGYPVFFALRPCLLPWFCGRSRPDDGFRGIARTQTADFGYVGVIGGFAGLLLQSRDGVWHLVSAPSICPRSRRRIGYFLGSS